MLEKSDALLRVQNKKFIGNNGKVMRAFNILSIGYCRLTDARIAADEYDISVNEFLISVNFLVKAGYLELRTIKEQEPVKELCDAQWSALEGEWTDKGTRLGIGVIKDCLVEM